MSTQKLSRQHETTKNFMLLGNISAKNRRVNQNLDEILTTK